MNRPEFERLGAYGRAISDDRLLENFEKPSGWACSACWNIEEDKCHEDYTDGIS